MNWQDDARVQEAALEQLKLVLSFFPRVETKISALFAVDAGMLGVLGVQAGVSDLKVWYLAILIALSAITIAASLWFLYRASFPQLEGGHGSLVFFREISQRTEANFNKELRSIDSKTYTDDLIGQVWRNSQILTIKFKNLRWAFIATALAVPIWFLTVLSATVTHSG